MTYEAYECSSRVRCYCSNKSEQIESPEQEADMDWRYKENEFVLEINEATFTNVFENLPYRAKKYYRCEHHFAHYMNAEWLFGRKNKGIVIDGCSDYGISH